MNVEKLCHTVQTIFFFLKVVDASDVILEVLDARDPLGCRCPQVEQAVIQSGMNKKIVLVLNKIGKLAKYILKVYLSGIVCISVISMADKVVGVIFIV